MASSAVCEVYGSLRHPARLKQALPTCGAGARPAVNRERGGDARQAEAAGEEGSTSSHCQRHSRHLRKQKVSSIQERNRLSTAGEAATRVKLKRQEAESKKEELDDLLRSHKGRLLSVVGERGAYSVALRYSHSVDMFGANIECCARTKVACSLCSGPAVCFPPIPMSASFEGGKWLSHCMTYCTASAKLPLQ